jgi:branched-subunit amino acid ABC-type transport system permease component
MRATSENPAAAQLLGIQVNRVAAAAWRLGALTAAVTGPLLAPLVTFNTTGLTLSLITAFGAALVGGLTSLPLTFLGGIVLGVAQSLLTVRPQPFDTAKDVVTIAVILAVLLLRREARVLAISTRGGEAL